MYSSQIIFHRLRLHSNIGMIRRRLAMGVVIPGTPAVSTCVITTPSSTVGRPRPIIARIAGSVTSRNAPIDHHHHPQQQQQLLERYFSTTTNDDGNESPSLSSTSSKFALVDHAQAYEMAMQGRHGQQLALARLEGAGKDYAPFDPFLEEEGLDEYDDDNDDDDDDKNIVETGKIEPKTDENDAEGGYEADDDTDDDFYGDEDGKDLNPSRYKPDGSVRRAKSILATLRAGYPSGGLFAVVELGGIQHKLTTDDLLVVNRLQPLDTYRIGSVHTLTDVMLVSSSHMTLVGMPFVAGAEVDVMVEEITQDAKVIIFKKRRRKHSQRKNGYRRDLTLLRVLDIRLPAAYEAHKHVGRDSVDALADVPSLVSSSSSSSSSDSHTASTTGASKARGDGGPANKDATSAKTTIEQSPDHDDDEDSAPPIRVAQ